MPCIKIYEEINSEAESTSNLSDESWHPDPNDPDFDKNGKFIDRYELTSGDIVSMNFYEYNRSFLKSPVLLSIYEKMKNFIDMLYKTNEDCDRDDVDVEANESVVDPEFASDSQSDL